jgi:hypothetical protein
LREKVKKAKSTGKKFQIALGKEAQETHKTNLKVLKKPRSLFALFIIYSGIALIVSVLLIASKITGATVIPTQVFGTQSNIIETSIIIIPWILFLMNTHYYILKNIEGAKIEQIFIGVTILQGFLSVIALIILLALKFF